MLRQPGPNTSPGYHARLDHSRSPFGATQGNVRTIEVTLFALRPPVGIPERVILICYNGWKPNR